MERWLADGAPSAEWMCAVMCRFRRSVRAVAPLARADHADRRGARWRSWRSFTVAFQAIVEARTVDDLAALPPRSTLVVGQEDAVCPPCVVAALVPTGARVLT